MKESVHRQCGLPRKVLARIREIEKAGSWKPLITTRKKLQPGNSGTYVSAPPVTPTITRDAPEHQ